MAPYILSFQQRDEADQVYLSIMFTKGLLFPFDDENDEFKQYITQKKTDIELNSSDGWKQPRKQNTTAVKETLVLQK